MFDGYRSQLIIDNAAVSIFTRRGIDWTAKYRAPAGTANGLNVQNVAPPKKRTILKGFFLASSIQSITRYATARAGGPAVAARRAARHSSPPIAGDTRLSGCRCVRASG
jgi:hypothetical protein